MSHQANILTNMGFLLKDPSLKEWRCRSSKANVFSQTTHILIDLKALSKTYCEDFVVENVPPAIEKCKSAGIKVVIVTGDHPATAHAIAKEVGIIWGKTGKEIREENKLNPKYEGKEELPVGSPGYDEAEDPEFAPAIVVAGDELDHLTVDNGGDMVWDDYLRHEQIVFARTTPLQKLSIGKYLSEGASIANRAL